jgi:hypothetical protein
MAGPFVLLGDCGVATLELAGRGTEGADMRGSHIIPVRDFYNHSVMVQSLELDQRPLRQLF